MILYHRTTEKAARAIRQHGFRDATGLYMTGRLSSGVWFSDTPLDYGEGAKGPVLLRVILPITRPELRRYEWQEMSGEKPYREFQIPASFVNARRRSIQVIHDWRAESEYRPRFSAAA